MIKSLSIKNFQSHKKTKLEFHPGVNIIKGQSHSGKSSIIRSLRWIFFNEPRGDQFKSHFASTKEDVSAEIELDSNVTITRIKDGKNSYRLNNERFDALGTQIPQEIETALNISPLNLQTQADNFFLLNESAGKVAEYLNSAIGLSIIQSCVRSINSLLRKTKEQLGIHNETIEDIDAQLTKYDWIDGAQKQIDNLLAKQKELDITIKKLNALEDIVHHLEQQQEKFHSFRKILRYEKTVQDIILLITEKQKLEQQILKLLETEKNLNKQHSYYKQTITYISAEKCIKQLIEYMKQKDSIQLNLMRLVKLYNKLNELKNTLKNFCPESLQKEYDALLSQIGICPICKRRV